MHPAARILTMVTLLALEASAAVGAAASVDPAVAGDGMTSHGPVDLAGRIESTAASGAVYVRDGGWAPGTRVRADSVEVIVQWEKGVAATVGTRLVEYVTDSGQDATTFVDVDVSFDEPRTPAQLLAFPDGGRQDVAFRGTAAASLHATKDYPLVRVGTSPGTREVGEGAPGGFWYVVEGAAVRQTGAGSASVRGSFSVFVDNVTIHAATDGGAQWSAWTGYREMDGGPVTRYERRLTSMRATNGTLVTPASDTLELFAPVLAVRLDGVLSCSDASGRWPDSGQAGAFERDPVVVEGSGTLAVRALDATATAGSGAPPVGPAYLRVEPSPGFRVLDPPAAVTPSGGRGALAGAMDPGALLVFGALAAASIVVAARVVPGPVAAWRRNRYAVLVERGRDASSEGRFVEAARLYRKAVRIKRDEPVAWYQWALAELEAGRYDAADRVASQAARLPQVDRLDLLELRAAAAWYAGDGPALQRHLGELVAQAPEMARGLVHDLGIDASRIEPGLRGLLGAPAPGGQLDGYA